MSTENKPTTVQSAHTPTPWKAARTHEDFDGPLYDLEADDKTPPFKRIYGSNGFAAISCHDLATISDADATLIVRAVNSHAELVEFVSTLQAQLIDALDGAGIDHFRSMKLARIVERAETLARATKGQS